MINHIFMHYFFLFYIQKRFHMDYLDKIIINLFQLMYLTENNRFKQ